MRGRLQAGRGVILAGALVLFVGALAVWRYAGLAREHPEARQGFELLLAMSLAVVAVFIVGLAVILRAEGRHRPGGRQD